MVKKMSDRGGMLFLVIFWAAFLTFLSIGIYKDWHEPCEVEVIEKEVVVIEPVIEYVDRVVIETETEIIYVELPCIEECETTLTAAATHQDYLDWFEQYEDLLDDFIDRLYWETFQFDDLLEDYEQYLSTKMTNGESLTPEEVEFLLDYQERIIEWREFEDWLNNEIQPAYEELLDEFPQEEVTE